MLFRARGGSIRASSRRAEGNQVQHLVKNAGTSRAVAWRPVGAQIATRGGPQPPSAQSFLCSPQIRLSTFSNSHKRSFWWGIGKGKHYDVRELLRDAQATRRSGNVQAALAKIDEAMQAQMKTVGGPSQMDGDPVTTYLLYERALTCSAAANYPEAETMFRKAADLSLRHFGAKNPQLAQIFNSLGLCYLRQDNLVDAEKSFRTSFDIRMGHQTEAAQAGAQTGFPDDLMQSQVEAEVPFHNLCALLFHQGRFQEIDKLCKSFEDFSKTSVTIKELSMARFYLNWAQALEKLEKMDSAIEKLRKGLRIQEDRLDRNDPAIASTLAIMARMLVLTPDGSKEAVGNLRRALTVFSEKSGRASVDTITALLTLSTALEKQDELQAALSTLDDAVERIETEFPRDDPLQFDALIGPLRAQVPLLIVTKELSKARSVLMRVIECTQKSKTPKLWIGVQIFSIVQLLAVLRDLNMPDDIRRAQELYDTIKVRWEEDIKKYVEDGSTSEARYLRTIMAEQKEASEKAKKDVPEDVRKLFGR